MALIRGAGVGAARLTGGRKTVSYRDAKGVTRDAVVIGGSGNTLDLSIRQGGGGTRKVLAVSKGTRDQTNVWF